jgi:hypothetical protein
MLLVTAGKGCGKCTRDSRNFILQAESAICLFCVRDKGGIVVHYMILFVHINFPTSTHT